MNKLSFKRRLALVALISGLVFPLSAQEQPLKASVAVLPLAGEFTEMASRFRRGIVDSTGALGKYYPWAVENSLFQIAGLEIPTDMPPRPDLIPDARYALSGGLYMGIRAGEYYLQLWLWDMNGPTMIYTDDLVYSNMDEAMLSLPGLVEWLFSHIHEEVIEVVLPPVQSDPLLAVGFKAGPSQRWYTDPAEVSPGAFAVSYEGGIWTSLRLNSLLSIQLEALFSQDNLVYRGLNYAGNNIYVMAHKKFSTYSFMFPLVLKLNFRPGLFRISPMAGIYAALPLGKAHYTWNGDTSYSWSFSMPLGATLGIEGARKYGSGFMLAGLRYSRGFGNVEIKDGQGTKYSRDILSLYLGYEFGFLDRNKNKK
ncbi:MAG: PorT family protein [Treponema sp.]|nr:PorT family protein [Treponema sp.]